MNRLLVEVKGTKNGTRVDVKKLETLSLAGGG